jgi:predicted TIM-barrel fold metal-dependent hydrolase
VNVTRLGEMDAAGIDYSLLSLNARGVQAETDPRRASVSAGQVNDTLAQIVAANRPRYGGLATGNCSARCGPSPSRPPLTCCG